MHAAVRIRPDRHQQQRRVRVDCGAGELQELCAFGTGIGDEQLLALVETQNGKRIGWLVEQRAARRRLPQLLQQGDELCRRRQPVAQRGARRPQRKARVHVFQRSQ